MSWYRAQEFSDRHRNSEEVSSTASASSVDMAYASATALPLNSLSSNTRQMSNIASEQFPSDFFAFSALFIFSSNDRASALNFTNSFPKELKLTCLISTTSQLPPRLTVGKNCFSLADGEIILPIILLRLVKNIVPCSKSTPHPNTSSSTILLSSLLLLVLISSSLIVTLLP